MINNNYEKFKIKHYLQKKQQTESFFLNKKHVNH